MMRANLSTLTAATAIALLATGSSLAPAAPTAKPTESVRLQKVLDALVAAGVPGAIVLIRHGDRTTRLASGYGNLAPRTPMRAKDRFRIGSETKTFVATVVLQLVGERKLTLQDTVERWLPGIVPNGRAITVHQLLNHTSGLFDYAEDKAFEAQLDNPTKTWTPSQLVRLAVAHKPLFAPGAKHSYSNTGYILLGLIVEKATSHPLAQELRRRIFAPLHLRATSFDTEPLIAGRHTHGYTRFHKPRLTDISVISPSIMGAAGAIVSTADDLTRFHRGLLGGRLQDLRLKSDATCSAASSTSTNSPPQHNDRVLHPCAADAESHNGASSRSMSTRSGTSHSATSPRSKMRPLDEQKRYKVMRLLDELMPRAGTPPA